MVNRNREDIFFGFFGRFELYSITIGKLLGKQKDLPSIHVDGSRYEVVYERDKDDNNFSLGKPLPLTGPKFASSGEEGHLAIVLGVLGHNWWFEIPQEGEGKGPIVKDFEDRYTGSTATICYELISCGTDARFEFKFEDSEDRFFEIVDGEICATTDGKPDTKRVLRSFNYGKNSTVVLEPNQTIPLHRSRIGVPLHSEIHVTVSLTCQLVPPPPGKRKRTNSNFTISDTRIIYVPERHKVEHLCFPLKTSSVVSDVGPCLSMKVTVLDEVVIDLNTLGGALP